MNPYVPPIFPPGTREDGDCCCCCPGIYDVKEAAAVSPHRAINFFFLVRGGGGGSGRIIACAVVCNRSLSPRSQFCCLGRRLRSLSVFFLHSGCSCSATHSFQSCHVPLIQKQQRQQAAAVDFSKSSLKVNDAREKVPAPLAAAQPGIMKQFSRPFLTLCAGCHLFTFPSPTLALFARREPVLK